MKGGREGGKKGAISQQFNNFVAVCCVIVTWMPDFLTELDAFSKTKD